MRTSAVSRGRQLALGRLGKGFEQHLGDDEAEHAVAEELEALVAVRCGEAAALAMGQRRLEQFGVGEAVAEPALEAVERRRRPLLIGA